MPVKKLSDLTTLTGITGTDSIYIARSGTNYNTTISNVISGMNINTGTGTLNYVVKFTATGTTVGDSIIFDDGTNVGIGINPPASKLHIVASSSNVRIDGTPDGNGLLHIRPNSGSAGYITFTENDVNNRGAIGFAAGDGDMNFITGGLTSIKMVIDSSGNVGIGTTGPGAKLHVSGGNMLFDNTYGLYFKDSGGTARQTLSYDSGDHLNFNIPIAGADMYIGTVGNINFRINSVGSIYLGGTSAASSPVMLVNASSNNVGIGIMDPTAALHLKAGTATASTAPLKFTSGTLLGTAEAGAIEFLTDAFYGTITTGAARKTFAFLESPTFTGTVTIPTPFTLGAISVTTTGTQLNYLSSATGTTGTTSTNIVFSTSPTITYLSLVAGGTGVGTGALKFTSGSLLSSIESGVVEFDGNTYYVSTSMRHALNGTIYVSTGNAGPSGSTTETTLIGSGPSWCSVVLPINYLVAGKTFLLRAAGTYTTPAGSTTFTIKFKLTSTNSNYILATSTFTPSASITSESWNLDLIFTCRATGAYSTPATISPRAILEYQDSTASATALQHAPMVTASGSAYTDQAITIALTSTIGGTYSSANWTCTNFSIVMLD